MKKKEIIKIFTEFAESHFQECSDMDDSTVIKYLVDTDHETIMQLIEEFEEWL